MRRRCPPTQVAPWICPFLSPELASRIRCFFRQPLARSSLQSIIACRLTDVSAVSQCYQPDPYRSAAIPHSAISLECTMTSGLIWYSIAPACHKHNPPALGGRPHVSQSCFFPSCFAALQMKHPHGKTFFLKELVPSTMQAARCLASNDYMHVVALMSKSDSRGKCLGSNDYKHVVALMSESDSGGQMFGKL